MFAFVIEPEGSDHDAMPEIQLRSSKPADLVGQLRLGSGIKVKIDLARPRQWRSVSVANWEHADLTLLAAVIGDGAFGNLLRLRDDLRGPDSGRSEAEVPLDVQPPDAWLRVAVTDALDRWLQLPLDQSLVDAERGVARGRAARTLPPGAARERLTGEGLMMARLAAKGLATYLAELAESTAPPPQALLDRLADLVGGYTELGREVVDGPDTELDEVAAAWSTLTAAVPAVGRPGERDADRADTIEIPITLPREDSSPLSRVDPRQLRARVVDLSSAAGEIRMESTQLGEEPAVRVTVPAYRQRPPSSSVADRLLVRLVDNRSAEVHGTALLTLGSETGAAAPVFTGVVPLGDAAPEDLRADVFDAGSEIPPAPADTDTDLLRVRRAANVLRVWRRTMARDLLTADRAARSRRLIRLAEDVAPAMKHDDQPVFYGGPSTTQLVALIDETAVAGTEGWAGTTSGVGDFLVAELAAVHTIQ